MDTAQNHPTPDNQRLLEDFLTLVQIDSPSYAEAQVVNWVSQALMTLGCQVYIDDTSEQTGSNSGNLIATLSATSGNTGRVFLSAHADTAQPGNGVKPVIKDGIITSAGETVLGSDDKVGIAAIIETVRVLTESNADHPEVVILISVAEEEGLLGAQAMDAAAIGFAGEPCFVLDAGGAPGEVIIGAPFHITYTAKINGKSAHAGVSPETGVSAIAVAAKAIAQMPQGRIDSMTTANVGKIEGGSANNVVADTCSISGEMRSLEQARLEAIREQIDSAIKTAAADAGAEVEVHYHQAYSGFKLDEDDSLVQLVLDTAKELGLSAQASYTGGGSDANIFAGKGLNPVVLATGMTDVHSKDESLRVVDLQDLTRLIVAIVLKC